MIKILSCADITGIADADIRHFVMQRTVQLFSGGVWDADLEGYMVVVEAADDIQSDYDFVGNKGLVSDTFNAGDVGDDAFGSPFEIISHHPVHAFYEAYLQCNDDMGIVFIIPDAVVEAHADLKQLFLLLQVPFLSGACCDDTCELGGC